jgi:hypothetical protein
MVSKHKTGQETASMEEVTTIGIDVAKNVFQLHGATADGSVVFRKKLSRPQFQRFVAEHPRCRVAMDACASAHHWAREMSRHGHEVRLIAPRYVKPFIKRQKMGWLPPSPNGIARCQGRGAGCHEKERTADEGYDDRGGLGQDRVSGPWRHDDWRFEVPQEADAVAVPAVHVGPIVRGGGDGTGWTRPLRFLWP